MVSIRFIGKLLMIAIFLSSGAHKLATFNPATGGPLAGYMGPKVSHFFQQISKLTGAELSVPKAFYPQMLLMAGIVEVLGSALVILNVKFGSILLASYLLPTSVIMHNFWDMPPESQQYQAEMVQFMKNVAIMGGLLVLTTTFKTGAASKDKKKWE